jgi:signal transduction histidine kinase
MKVENQTKIGIEEVPEGGAPGFEPAEKEEMDAGRAEQSWLDELSFDVRITSLFRRLILPAFFWVVLITGLYLTSRHSYLLFHSIVEVFAMVVACSIFMIAWNTRKFMDNNYLLFLGIAALSFAVLEAFHALSYRGMEIFRIHGTNLPTQLWIVSRYLLSFSLLLAPFFLNRKLRPRLIFSIYTVITFLLLVDVFYWGIFPDCFIEGKGLTTFKIASEYVISLMFVLALIALTFYKKAFDRESYLILFAFIVTSIASEISFTFYNNPYGFSNFVGHILLLFSFYLLYKVLIMKALRQPYHLLFRNLKQSEEALRESESQYRSLSEHLEEKVQEKVKELELAQRLAAIGQMVSVVAHEVRNPLQNISFGIESVRREVGNDQELAEIMDEIDYGVSSLNHIVTELLDYSRPITLNVTGWRISALLERALQAVSEELRNIEVNLEMQDEMREIQVDAPKLIRVLVNILSNAAEAMADEGIIDIRSHFFSRSGREFVCLRIHDNGPGMKNEHFTRIFEPFFTTKIRGTGLGLPICKKLIEAHNGFIAFQSKLNQGTTVEIVLPVEQ